MNESRGILFLFILVAALVGVLYFGTTAFAGGEEPIGSVSGSYESEQATKYVDVPVYHDTKGRTMADLGPMENRYYNSVPTVGGLRDEVGEMLPARVIDVPACAYHQKYLGRPLESCSQCGLYTPGDSRRLFGIYQAWTGPHKARVPLVPGPAGRDGRDGCDGAPGPKGDKGDKGDTGTGITNNYYSFGSLATGSYQLGGAQAPMISSTSLLGVGWQQSSRISIVNTANATGGHGGNVGPITNTNNNSNANTNVNPNNNVINIGDGSASGTATGTGDSGANSGNRH